MTPQVDPYSGQGFVPSLLKPNAARFVVQSLVLFDAGQSGKLFVSGVVWTNE